MVLLHSFNDSTRFLPSNSKTYHWWKLLLPIMSVIHTTNKCKTVWRTRRFSHLPSHFPVLLHLLRVAQQVRKLSAFYLGLNPKFHYRVKSEAVAHRKPSPVQTLTPYFCMTPLYYYPKKLHKVAVLENLIVLPPVKKFPSHAALHSTHTLQAKTHIATAYHQF